VDQAVAPCAKLRWNFRRMKKVPPFPDLSLKNTEGGSTTLPAEQLKLAGTLPILELQTSSKSLKIYLDMLGK
jgi:hypothetical protein